MAGNGIAAFLIVRLCVVVMAPRFAALPDRGGTAAKQGAMLTTLSLAIKNLAMPLPAILVRCLLIVMVDVNVDWIWGWGWMQKYPGG